MTASSTVDKLLNQVIRYFAALFMVVVLIGLSDTVRKTNVIQKERKSLCSP